MGSAPFQGLRNLDSGVPRQQQLSKDTILTHSGSTGENVQASPIFYFFLTSLPPTLMLKNGLCDLVYQRQASNPQRNTLSDMPEMCFTIGVPDPVKATTRTRHPRVPAVLSLLPLLTWGCLCWSLNASHTLKPPLFFFSWIPDTL